MLNVLETSGMVSEKSLHVRIDNERLRRFSGEWLERGIEVPPWDSTHHYSGDPEKMVSYFLVLDTLNFCFWATAGTPKWEIEFEGRKLDGYNALAVALKRAFSSEVPITQADFLANITRDDLNRILGGRGELQLLDERLHALHELGRALSNDFNGKAHKLVASAGNSASRLAELLALKLPSFRDVTEYRGVPIQFLKRAQILATDLYGAFKGQAFGHFEDMDKLTAFADYKLPQVLRHIGILKYDKILSHKIDRKRLIESGSSEEVEIRANTILAVELLRKELFQAGKDLKPFEIDWALWNMGQDDEFRKKPYHRTVTIFY